MPDVITMGEALIDFVPQQVDCFLEEVSDFHRAPGGAPANVAVGLARLGVNTGFMGKVGNDAFGRFLQRTLAENEVDTSQLVLTEEAMTTLAFVSLRSDGERDFAFYRKPGADMLYRTEEVDFNYLTGAKIFHFGSISLIVDPAKTTTLELVKYARDNGIMVSFDPNIRSPLWDSLDQAVRTIKETIPLADMVKVNEEELEILTDVKLDVQNMDEAREQLKDACREIYEEGPELVVVTLGNQGSFYYSNTGSGYVPGFKVKAIDTTGAGDGFVAAVLSKLSALITSTINDSSLSSNTANYNTAGSNSSGCSWLGKISSEELEEILTFANKVGAITTTRHGGIPSLPMLEEVEELEVG